MARGTTMVIFVADACPTFSGTPSNPNPVPNPHLGILCMHDPDHRVIGGSRHRAETLGSFRAVKSGGGDPGILQPIGHEADLSI